MIVKFFHRPANFIAVCVALSTALVACLGISPAASAHEPFEITSNVRVYADRISLNIIITDTTAATLCLEGSAPALHEKEFATEHSRIQRCAAELYVVRRGGTRLSPSAVQMHLSEEKDLDATITYPAGIGDTLSFEAIHLARLKDPGYGATLTATGDGVFLGQKLLRADDPRIEVSLAPQGAAQHPQSGFMAFLRLGIEHILTGYDHLLFLAGLLIVCRNVRSALIIITSFTLAHSITLGLAGLGLITLPSRLVESFIAATIVYVGLENLWLAHRANDAGEPRRRWLLSFAFGLMHGFGFASALQEIGLPHDPVAILPPLLAFNAGVELGQLAIAAACLPLLFWLRRKTWFARYGISTTSLVVVAAGAWWFIKRTAL